MKSVLITGGTGSFGQAFTERLLKDGRAERICIYSRGEHAQAGLRDRLLSSNNGRNLRFFIGDVRDRERLQRAMEGCDVVVHAAALKRIEVGHYNPNEMVKTNVIGAMNVVEAAQDTKVKKVVALSTDKAYQPVSPYGYSKALAECIFLAANNTSGRAGPSFTCTRYGNVWDSAGSVVPLWRQMLASGIRKVPVTDPDCTRFFMLMGQAVDFVLRAIDEMPPEVMIPELPAWDLRTLAASYGITRFIKRDPFATTERYIWADSLVPFVEQNMNPVVGLITGLPSWEKKHESMCEGRSSEHARRMTVDELRAHL